MAKKDYILFELWEDNQSFREIVIIVLLGLIIIALVLLSGLNYYIGLFFAYFPGIGRGGAIALLVYTSIAMSVFAYRRWDNYKNEKLEKENAEYRMQKSKVQLQAVHDGIPDIILQVDLSLRVLWANKAMLDINPYCVGQRCHNALSYTEGTFIDSYCKWAMDMGRIEKGIKYSPQITGSEAESYWECIAIPLKGKDNKVYGSIAIARDVTQRMRVEHTWNLLASIVESTDDAIYGISIDGTVISWNEGAEKTYGYHSEEIVGKNVSMMVPIDRRKELFDMIEIVMRKKIVERFETSRIRSDGESISVSITICPFLDATGRKVGVSTIERDITASKIAQQALLESEERYRSFVQNFKGIAFRAMPDFTPVFFHGAVEEITGYMSEDFNEGRINWRDLIHRSDLKSITKRSHKNIASFISDTEFEYRIKRKDGNYYWVQEYSQNLYDESGDLVLIQGTVYNISQRKVAEGELKLSREQFRNLAIHFDNIREEERKQIAFEIHDELGYALTAMKLDLAWLKNKISPDQPKASTRLNEMAELIDSTIKKIRTISTQLRPSILDHFGLVAAIEWQANEFQKRMAVRCNINLEGEDLMFDDRFSTAVFRIMQEALTNIARHAKATRVDVELKIDYDTLGLTITDNGVGMESDPFKNTKSFGLLGMRERAKFMDGDLRIISEKGKGTVINLEVPVKLKEIVNDQSNNS